MKTEAELNHEILVTRLKKQEYSSKSENSTTDGSDPHPNLESTLAYNKFLDIYLDSLKKILKKYREDHRE
jgi:hypothetical protein